MSERGWKQLRIIHISDMHFGRNHFFNPPGSGADSDGRSLLNSIVSDLGKLAGSNPGPENRIQSEVISPSEAPRVIVALTGDFNEHCSEPEFKKSRSFLSGLYGAVIFNRTIDPSDIFLIPGNHDLKYAEEDLGDRWGKFVLFYQDHDDERQKKRGKPSRRLDPRDPIALTRIIDQSDEGLVIAEINSCAYVQKGTRDERRGQIHDDAVDELEKQLEAIDAEALHSSIKIALIHHHPVVLPVLYEPDDGYDAVLNAEMLFRVLKKFGFHLVLHGHKHAAVTYSYDAVSAWTTDGVQPLLVIAGGSAGSTEIPREQGALNTYNIINIKWHPKASQARVNIQTRGHVWSDSRGRMQSPRWFWKPLRVDDRLLTASKWIDSSQFEVRDWTERDFAYEPFRAAEAARLRRNFPCLEVVPSLDDDQAYEGRLWIDGQTDRDDYVPPDKVEWAASPHFFPQIHVCHAEVDPQFRAVFAYYGPTLIQARLTWGEYEELAYIFARFPRES